MTDPADVARVRDDARRWGITAEVGAGDAWWSGSSTADRALLVHDALCPLVTAEFIGSLLQRAEELPGTPVAAVRGVTDTLKVVVGDRITGTIDRDSLVTVTSPVLVPAELLAGAGEAPPVCDAAALVGWLRARGEVELVRAPSLGRRIGDVRAVRLLESLDEVGHRVRAEAGHAPA